MSWWDREECEMHRSMGEIKLWGLADLLYFKNCRRKHCSDCSFWIRVLQTQRSCLNCHLPWFPFLPSWDPSRPLRDGALARRLGLFHRLLGPVLHPSFMPISCSRRVCGWVGATRLEELSGEGQLSGARTHNRDVGLPHVQSPGVVHVCL